MDRILIIEDDEYVQKMLKQTLERAGYEVAAATNGATGLKLYETKLSVSEPFNLVITENCSFRTNCR